MSGNQLDRATLAGGCFWCIEAAFEQIEGVRQVVSGYSGGTVHNPSYEQVCTGATGHAEVVQITFDPDAISFKELLDIFFVVHDPTTLNRQGPDVGTQYRSAIFYHSPEQRTISEQVIKDLEETGVWSKPIITNLQPLAQFYQAEDYHQGYYRQNSGLPYCNMVIAPKVVKLRKSCFSRLKKQVSA